MIGNRGEHIRLLFDTAMELPAADRKIYLLQASEGDTELVEQAMALLACAEEEDIAPSRPIITASMRGQALHAMGAATPTHIGPYRVIKKIGTGSMGTVYQAHQDALQRIVAIKLLRASVSTNRMLRRFEFEAQALAQLSHAYIAKVFDVGTTKTVDGSQPYIAMEYVQGVSLNAYAENAPLTTRQRISLLIKICGAIHHAHQRGIIHRDLKPSNILIDQDGQPRVVDFGVARSVDHNVEATSHATEIGELVGTLSYMSPEQASGQQGMIDTQTDVYALGVIGYELIAGQLPFDIDQLPLAKAVDIITNNTPKKIGTIHNHLRGDLELIISTAMQRDKSLRYQSASDFATDLRRYQHDHPILARPPSIYYQMSKYAKRHKAGFTGAIAVLMALILGVMGTTYGFIRAVEQRTIAEGRLQEAQQAQDESEIVTSLLSRIIESVNPRDLGRDVLVLDLLDEACQGINEDLTTNPLVKAKLHQTIGTSYFSLGQYANAEKQLEKALTLRRRELGRHHSDTAASAAQLALLYIECDRNKEALPLAQYAYSTLSSLLGKKHKSTLDAMNSMAMLYYRQRQFDKAESLYKNNLTLQRETLGNDHTATLDTEHNLAILYSNTQRYEEAESALRHVLERHVEIVGENHPDTLSTWQSIADVLQKQRKFEDAISITHHVLAIRKRVLGEDHPKTLMSMAYLANLFLNTGQLAKAETYGRQLLHMKQQLIGSENSSTAQALNQLGLISLSNGKIDEAETLFLRSLELKRQRYGDGHKNTLTTLGNLALVYTEQDRYDEAEALYIKALDIQRRILGEKHNDTLTTLHNLAGLRILQNQLTKAEPLCLKTVALSRDMFGDEHPDTLNAINTLTILYEKQGRTEEVEKMYLETIDIQKRMLGRKHELVLASMNNLGDFYNTIHRYADAELVLRDLVETSRSVYRKEHWYIGVFLTKYGQSLIGLEQFDQAVDPLLEARDILSNALGQNHHRTTEANKALEQALRNCSTP